MSLGKCESIFDPDAISLTPFATPGELFEYKHPTYGYQVYRHVQYDGAAATAAQGEALTFVTGSSTVAAQGVAATVKGNVAGVVQRAAGVPDTYWCMVLVRGRGLILSDAAILVDTAVSIVTASGLGRFDDAGLTDDRVIAQCKQATAVGAGELLPADVCIL